MTYQEIISLTKEDDRYRNEHLETYNQGYADAFDKAIEIALERTPCFIYAVELERLKEQKQMSGYNEQHATTMLNALQGTETLERFKQKIRTEVIEEYKTALKSKVERECKYLSDGGCTTTEYLDPYYIDNVAERLKEQK